MVGERRFFSKRDWMMFCIFALTFLYNKLFYSLTYVHLLQVLNFLSKYFAFYVLFFILLLLFTFMHCNLHAPRREQKKLRRENNKIVEEKGNKNEKGAG